MGKELSINIDYTQWFSDLKKTIKSAQIKAALQVNSELICMYWNLGKEIAEHQLDSVWGKGFFAQLSKDLQAEFPEMKGFSETNLKYIKRFYLFYNQSDINRHQLGDDLLTELSHIPWRHHVEIFTHSKSVDEAYFYIRQTIENNWSRSVLTHQIESQLYGRSGRAVTNFTNTMPSIQGELAQQVTKDPYIFDFMEMTNVHNERELENCLASNMTKFLLELGTGFAYYGRQVHLNVNGDDFYIDLLFYNLKLRCYVVVELKTVKFMPEHAGQLKFYITAVDKQMRTEHDNATIGILICKDKNDVVAEYALQDITAPIGVSSYKLYNHLSENFKSSLPTIEEIENALNKDND